MIVYKELSSLVSDLGFSARTLYSVSNSISDHYRTTFLPKDDGGVRELSVPDPLLKSIQKQISEVLLPLKPISPYATGYRLGGSTRKNALPHVGKPLVLKLDIRHFFDNIIYPTVKKAFPSDRYSEQNRILLALLCSFRDTLPQGAPTSPGISNIIMRDFDFAVGQWCDSHAISYTRYCDDMTFSGEFDPASVIAIVRNELQKTGLFLNESKTTVVHKGQKQQVTGIVVNEAAHIPNDYKRKIRQEMYFCKKYGVSAHLDHLGTKISPEAYTASMLGRVNYVLSVEPSNSEMLHYRDVLRRK